MGYSSRSFVIFLIIVIVAVVFIVVTIGVINRIFYTNRQGVPGPLQGPCTSNSDCATNLSCDLPTSTCRYNLGVTCEIATDCLTGDYCSGVCVNGPFGALQQPCPCNAGLICANSNDNPAALICLLPGDAPCSANDQCVSNKCEDGKCKNPRNDGDTCVTNDNCASNNCSFYPGSTIGYCQAQGINTGDIGSICNKGAPCSVNSICFGNTCTSAIQGMSSVCTNISLCALPMNCLSTTDGKPCTSDDCGATAYSCEFTISNNIDPNTCNMNDCITTQTCSNNVCYNQSGQGCYSNSNCTSGVCSNTGIISQLSFNNSLPIGATVFGWTSLYPTPPNTSVKRIFSLMVQGTKNIYIVSNTGLYRRDTNAWTLIAPYTLTGQGPNGTLLDAAGQDNLLLIVYHQGVNITVYQATLPNTTLTPYNVQGLPGLPGTQYDTSNTPININSIDITSGNYVGLGDNNTKLYSKSDSDKLYTKIKDTDGSGVTNNDATGNKIRFYSNPAPTGITNYPQTLNVGYITNLNSDGCNLSAVVGFNGIIRGEESARIYYPVFPYPNCVDFSVSDYALFSVPVVGLESGYMILTAQDNITNMYYLYTVTAGVCDPIPTYVDINAAVWCDVDGFYLYQSGTCS